MNYLKTIHNPKNPDHGITLIYERGSMEMEKGDKVRKFTTHVEIFNRNQIARLTLNSESFTIYFKNLEKGLKFRIKPRHVDKLAYIAEIRFNNGLKVHQQYANMIQSKNSKKD